ncbi:MAG: YbaB/EbfC family nucleoid-associated protein [Candidatus Hydrogenedentes bacterium]|nr:YbaB/EbfC family nucleoid-associated protein [Candidatus Hydrogenedentota bacterium]
MAGMMKQAMQMKSRVEELKAKLADEQVEASAGGGMVTVVVNGKFELLSVKIDPEVIDKDEPEMLETLVRAAVNEGVSKVQALIQSKMKELTGGIDIPGLT